MKKETYKSENRIQQECVIYFHNNYKELRGLLFAVPNGGARSIREGKLLKQTGVISGVSDMLLMYNGITYCFELKTIVGKQSDTQKSWEKLVKKQGFEYYIIRDVSEFITHLKRIIC